MATIEETFQVKASREAVFQALVDPKIIEKWSGGPAEMGDRPGSPFSLFGGRIHGSNLEVVPNEELVQEWYAEGWTAASRATFRLESHNDETTVALRHEDIPDSELERIAQGWNEYYLGQIQKMFADEAG